MANQEDPKKPQRRRYSPVIDEAIIQRAAQADFERKIDSFKELHTDKKTNKLNNEKYLYAVETALFEKIGRERLLEAKYEQCLKDIQAYSDRETNLQNENALMKAKLSVRPYIEITQEEIIPYWLINKKYLTSYEKIFLSLKYRLTSASAVMCKRLDELHLGANYEPKASSSIVKTYYAFSKKVNHDDEPRPIKLSDEEWEVLFNDIGINDLLAKEIMKTVLNPITLDDLKKFGKIEEFFLVYANCLDIDLNESSELDTTTQIKKWCPSFADRMTNFTYPVTRDNYTNEVYFQVGNIDHAGLEQLKTQLGTHGKAKIGTSGEKHAVFYRTYCTS